MFVSEGRPGHLSPTPWWAMGTVVSWAKKLRRRPVSLRPVPNYPWYLRALDSTDSVCARLRLFMLPKGDQGRLSPVPWGAKWKVVSLAHRSAAVLPCFAPPRPAPPPARVPPVRRPARGTSRFGMFFSPDILGMGCGLVFFPV